MKSCHIISLAISIPIGVVLAIPSVMSFDAGDKTKSYMKLLGYSGLSVIPVAVTACAASVFIGNKKPLLLNLLPHVGIATAFAIGAIVEKNEQ